MLCASQAGVLGKQEAHGAILWVPFAAVEGWSFLGVTLLGLTHPILFRDPVGFPAMSDDV